MRFTNEVILVLILIIITNLYTVHILYTAYILYTSFENIRFCFVVVIFKTSNGKLSCGYNHLQNIFYNARICNYYQVSHCWFVKLYVYNYSNSALITIYSFNCTMFKMFKKKGKLEQPDAIIREHDRNMIHTCVIDWAYTRYWLCTVTVNKEQ